MLLVLDNYDSFTFNLVQYFGELGAEPTVKRNDDLTVAEALALAPEAIVISPGPCTPGEAGISVDLIRAAGEAGIPVLGVCLGHQAMAEAFGARVVRAARVMHGKTSPVVHRGDSLFNSVPSPIEAMRYHSLIVDPASVPPALEVIAWTGDRPEGEEIMAMRHRDHPIWGVQFHPESVGTSAGKQLITNFLSLAGAVA
ncbi:MAG TPA: aminodeoxychorismate/anthranilate synthase component II [Gemmatimonadales bacterium]|jgi:anthranilate synthase/aminodeoxychorismate synthase-like glutamine amidotransferase